MNTRSQEVSMEGSKVETDQSKTACCWDSQCSSLRRPRKPLSTRRTTPVQLQSQSGTSAAGHSTAATQQRTKYYWSTADRRLLYFPMTATESEHIFTRSHH